MNGYKRRMNPKPLCITRRGALIWLSVVLAAPFVTRKGGILMPIRNRTLLNTRELELLKEVQEWRQSITKTHREPNLRQLDGRRLDAYRQHGRSREAL